MCWDGIGVDVRAWRINKVERGPETGPVDHIPLLKMVHPHIFHYITTAYRFPLPPVCTALLFSFSQSFLFYFQLQLHLIPSKTDLHIHPVPFSLPPSSTPSQVLFHI